jgi:two-component system LytT family response regulator
VSIRAIIVDDEPLARQVLRELLEDHAEVEVLAECKNGFEAVKAVSELPVDLLFLDIQMPKLDGFEVLELLDRPVPTIFVTAYDEYAVRAFEAHAVDYLLKPVTPERLAEALSRVGGRTPPPNIASEARPGNAYLTRIVIKDGPDIVIIPQGDIDYVQAEDDYVCVHAKGRSFLKHQTMASLEASLDPAHFVRIHRSAIARLDRIKRIELHTKDRYIAILEDGTTLPISRAGHRRLKGLLG